MEKFRSLADVLGLGDPPVASLPAGHPTLRLEDISDPTAFARAVLESREFRQYIVSGLTLGNLPGFTSILQRMMDVAGWPKASSRVEHTGKDGQPIETVTEIRRVIVRMDAPVDLSESSERASYKTH